jgi:hypothetical protein
MTASTGCPRPTLIWGPDLEDCGRKITSLCSSFEERYAYPEALAIDFLGMSEAEDEHDQAEVFALADKPVITHAVFPELPKS